MLSQTTVFDQSETSNWKLMRFHVLREMFSQIVQTCLSTRDFVPEMAFRFQCKHFERFGLAHFG